MTRQSQRLAGVLLLVMPSVMYGGVTLLTMLVDDPGYATNPLRQDLWRAGHAHAGVLLLLSLVVLRYVDEAHLTGPLRAIARSAAPLAAILMPAGFFLSMASPKATGPNQLIVLTYCGAAVLALGVVILGFGLLRPPPRDV